MQIPIELNKKLGDHAIELIRDKLKDLAWLDEVYPAVKVGERLNGSTYPAIYVQKTHSKIFDLTPNSKLKSYIFFEKNGYEIEADSNIYDLSLILWANIKAIDEAIEYDQTDTLVQDIITILKRFAVSYVSVNFNNAFENYNLHESTMQMFMYPYSAVKINFKIKLDSNC